MLIAGLKEFKPRPPEVVNGRVVRIFGHDCQQDHILDALKRITGANPGDWYSDWSAWYRRKYGVDLPDWRPTKAWDQ